MLYKESKLICPICRAGLEQDGKSLVCENRHRFDIARQGYINLLPVQNKHSLSPGDTREMLEARRNFLNIGKYQPICDSVIRCIRQYSPCENPVLIDIGCGEGYYTSAFENYCNAKCIGIDISKDGAKMSCSRSKNTVWLVATASQLPVADCSADIVTAMFSLLLQEEYARTLKSGGCVIEVTVGSKHLIELKSIIYEEVFKQYKHPEPCGDDFDEIECQEYEYQITLDSAELKNLLLMTPHFWRIHKERRQQLENTDRLHVTVNYWVRVLKKK